MHVRKLVAAATIGLASLVFGSADAKTLRWASQGDALTLDPHSQNEGPTSAMAQHLYDPLIQRGPDLVKRANLALSWKAVAPDTWEFKLRPGVKFSDGS